MNDAPADPHAAASAMESWRAAETGRTVTPRPVLSTFAATMITVGLVIGAGIFQTPGPVAAMVGSPERMITAWILGGVLSFIGALSYAELASTYPTTGGDYTFLTRAYGRNVSFLFAWARTTVIVSGSIALIGFILGDYLSQFLRIGEYSAAMYAALAVIVLTAINLLGLRDSARMQSVLTLIEIAGVVLIGIAGLVLGSADTPELAGSNPSAADVTSGAFGLAMVFVLLTYGGWNEAAYVSAEVRSGPRAISRTLLLSMAIITTCYLVFVLGASRVLGFEGLTRSEAIGVDVTRQLWGPAGSQLVGALVAISALTSMNSTMLVGARSNYALSRDWPAFGFLGRWRTDRNTPVTGFLVQAAITLALILLGALEKHGFSTLVEFTAPVFWFFFMLSGIALFVLRRREPNAPRPFKVPAYPVLPLVFVLTCAYLLYSSIRHARSEHATYIAVSMMLTGAVVWALVRARERMRLRPV